MIRVCIFNDKAYGTDVTDWETKESNSGWYHSMLGEDLLERVPQGDIVMYFDTSKSCEEWCENHGFDYEFVENDNN